MLEIVILTALFASIILDIMLVIVPFIMFIYLNIKR